MKTDREFPYKDEHFGVWIYDRLPAYMRPAAPHELWVGRAVMYRSDLPPLEGLWVAEKLSRSSLPVARHKAARGEIFIK